MSKERCAATTESGEPCQSTVGIQSDGKCWFHSDLTVEARQQAASRGGKSSRKSKVRVASQDEVPRPPESLDDIVAWASWCAYATAVGLIDSGTSRQVTQALGELRRAIDKRDLSVEIEELRAQVKQLKRGR